MAIKTPQEYLESIRDGRVVYCKGERVPDVTRHPILKICIDWVATDYVIENDPKFQKLVLEKDEDGEMVPFAFMPQKNVNDLNFALNPVVPIYSSNPFSNVLKLVLQVVIPTIDPIYPMPIDTFPVCDNSQAGNNMAAQLSLDFVQ